MSSNESKSLDDNFIGMKQQYPDFLSLFNLQKHKKNVVLRGRGFRDLSNKLYYYTLAKSE